MTVVNLLMKMRVICLPLPLFLLLVQPLPLANCVTQFSLSQSNLLLFVCFYTDLPFLDRRTGVARVL